MKEYANKTKAELSALLIEKRKALRAFRFGTAGSKVRDVKEGANTRKDIARLLTVYNSKKIS